MAPPALIQFAGSKTNANATSNTVTLAAAPTNGNQLWAFVSTYYNRGLAGPVGWTLLGDNNGVSGDLFVYTKSAGASEPTSYAWTLTTADMSAIAVYETGQPVAGSVPRAIIPAWTQNAWGVAVNSPMPPGGFTVPQGANDLTLFAFAYDGGTAPTITPNGFTADQNLNQQFHSLVTGHAGGATGLENVSISLSTMGTSLSGSFAKITIQGADEVGASPTQANMLLAGSAQVPAGWIYKGRATSANDAGSVA